MENDIITRTAAIISATTAIVGGVFAFLNWKRGLLSETPRAWLRYPKPYSGCYMGGDIIFNNPSNNTVVIRRIVLKFGGIAEGSIIDKTGGSRPGEKTINRERLVNLVVPPKSEVKYFVSYYADEVECFATVQLKKKRGLFDASIVAFKQ